MQQDKTDGILRQNLKLKVMCTNLIRLCTLSYKLNSFLSQKAQLSLYRARQKYFQKEDKTRELYSQFTQEQ